MSNQIKISLSLGGSLEEISAKSSTNTVNHSNIHDVDARNIERDGTAAVLSISKVNSISMSNGQIQDDLRMLGFYNGPRDSNLSTRSSVQAIKKFPGCVWAG